MTVADLLSALSKMNPNVPVKVRVLDSDGSYPVIEVETVKWEGNCVVIE